MSQNRVIGNNNKLPWNIPEDLKWFKENTLGKPIVMGRKTHESIGKILKGRTNIVITKNASYSTTAKIYNSLGEALEAYRTEKEIVIIGGQQIYEQSIKLAKRIYLTEINAVIEGDAFFPELSQEWKVIYSKPGQSNFPFTYTFKIMER